MPKMKSNLYEIEPKIGKNVIYAELFIHKCLIMKCKYCGKNSRAKNSIFCSKKCHTYYSTELERKNHSKSVRISVIMDQDISDSLREIQSSLIKNATENVSFSQVVNLVLKEGIKIKKSMIKSI
jgi:hypothetical protein